MKTRAVHTSVNDQLFNAAIDGSTKEVERCLKQLDCDPLARDKHGRTALMCAARRGQEMCVRLLMSHSDPLARDNKGLSALMWAAYHGYETCMRFLLPVSDPLAKSNDGYSALMLTALDGYEDCVKVLLPASDPLAKSNDGRSASQIAMDEGHSRIAGMIDAYVLALNEAALLSTDILTAPPRRKNIIRI